MSREDMFNICLMWSWFTQTWELSWYQLCCRWHDNTSVNCVWKKKTFYCSSVFYNFSTAYLIIQIDREASFWPDSREFELIDSHGAGTFVSPIKYSSMNKHWNLWHRLDSVFPPNDLWFRYYMQLDYVIFFSYQNLKFPVQFRLGCFDIPL